MNPPGSSTLVYSRDEIQQQLERIFADPVFAVSDILKRFLVFVVEETMQGHSNQIKEYTIGVKVLNKPPSFDPRQDAIVRIHAGRLRRALHLYYREAGASDPLYISIPKGSYLPVFSENTPGTIAEVNHRQHEHLSVKNLVPGPAGPYIVTGDMQYSNDKLRISLQMTNTETHEELWSQVVEYKLTASTDIDIQDDIVKKLMAAVGDYYRLVKQHVGPTSILAA